MDPKAKQGRADRLAAKIAATLDGKSSGSVKLQATLTGPAADAWRGIKEAAEGLKMDDTALLAVLLDAGTSTVRQALKKVPRSTEG